ncbi:VOC family protein [Mangrovicella endophytica]|uniref:VOC family protein n=1 Tax=Mangrovicella endophytica TaxID=2066697 RepID=UPI000C9E0462|nr:VOC family protein [Mangrovicella endophytica]
MADAAAQAVIEGVLETCLYVADMEAARPFYEDVLQLKPLMHEDRITVYDLGPRSVLILFLRGSATEAIDTPGGSIPAHDASGQMHVAFSVPADSLPAWRRRFGDAGIAIESEVRWPRGGTSLYVRDHDSHVVELATPGLWPNS